MWFDDWTGIFRVLTVGTLAYASLVILLRASGKRTLSKMNAFDLIVTVAIGSTLATVLLSKDVALAEGVAALALLVGLQYVLTWLAVRSRAVERLIKAEPALVFFDGRFLDDALRRERVTEAEVRAAVRAQGLAAMEDATAVGLETDGSMTAVQSRDERALTALKGIGGGGRDRAGKREA